MNSRLAVGAASGSLPNAGRAAPVAAPATAADDGKSAITPAEYVLLHQTRNEDAPAANAPATGYARKQFFGLTN